MKNHPKKPNQKNTNKPSKNPPKSDQNQKNEQNKKTNNRTTFKKNTKKNNTKTKNSPTKTHNKATARPSQQPEPPMAPSRTKKQYKTVCGGDSEAILYVSWRSGWLTGESM
ncbi:MAG: hypothetical protein Q6363_004240 [Candidatus Njordarchaeota archaeon]